MERLMRFLSTNVHVGPNLYARFPVIRHVVDLGPLEAWPTGRLGAAFRGSLLAALPGLAEHGCSYGEPGGFVKRLTDDEGTWLGHVLEHVAIELQVIAGNDVTFGKTRGNGEPGQYDMVFAYLDREVGLEAADLGRNLLLSLLPDDAKAELDAIPEPLDWDEERDDFIRSTQRRALGPSTNSLVQAARDRDIPWLRLNKYSLVQFGHGKYQRRIQATVTSETSHIAVEIASDKEETHDLMRELGLPVPIQRVVQSPARAVRAARHIGFPVVLKPLDGNHGRGVSINLTTDEEVEEAFHIALEQAKGRSVVVETFVTGYDHRMLVVDGKLVAVAKRVPGHVTGDGAHTIAQLVDIVNADPRRGVGHEKVLTRLELDRPALGLMQAAGYDADSVLSDGELLHLRTTANLSTGGTAIDLTDVCHPDNRMMAERAVKAVGLDVGGVDFLTDDITRSYKEIGGGIVEVNAAPGFRMHVAPSEGQPRDVAGAVIDMLFPPGTPTRIPIAAITGTNGKTTTSRMVAHILKTAGKTVGMTSTDGVYVDGQLTVKGDLTGPGAARMVLRDPSVDVAVMETARGGLLRSGLGFSRADVGAVLNVTADHLGLGGIETVEQLAAVKRIVAEVASDTAVLNADDEHCLAMAAFTKAEHLCYVTLAGEHHLVREHVRAGGRGIVLEQGLNGSMITIYDRGAHVPLLWTHLIPATLEGRALHNVQNAMFAAAITYSMDVKLEDIRLGLRTFDTSFFQVPGRMNLHTEHPFDVLLDYAHNPAAVQALTDTVDRFDITGHRTVVLAAPGDRRDEDIEEIARIVLGHYDRYVCKADDQRRGRGDDEVPRMLEAVLLAGGVNPSAIEVITDEQQAIDHALRASAPGDLLVVLGDDVTRCWKQIINFSAHGERPTRVAAAAVGTVGIGSLLSSTEFIRDERGVRVAVESED
ncbi:MAG: cyanophycin synthetase [Nitriliruptoraceae bacterium]|jgi:cyanophycin synthetase